MPEKIRAANSFMIFLIPLKKNLLKNCYSVTLFMFQDILVCFLFYLCFKCLNLCFYCKALCICVLKGTIYKYSLEFLLSSGCVSI